MHVAPATAVSLWSGDELLALPAQAVNTRFDYVTAAADRAGCEL
jgi:hypothetical protein